MKTVSNIKDIMGINSVLGKNTWYFKNEKKTKRAEFYAHGLKASLKIEVKEQDLGKYQTIVPIITTSNSFSRTTLLNSYGFANFKIRFDKTSKRTVTFHPSLLLCQFLSNKDIPLLVNNIQAEIPGLDQWFKQSLMDFSGAKREFREKKNVYQVIKFGPALTATLSLDFASKESRTSFSAKHDSYIRLDFSEPYNYAKATKLFKPLEEFFNFIFPEVTSQFHFRSIENTNTKKPPAVIDIISMNLSDTNVPPVRKENYGLLFSILDVDNSDKLILNWCLNYSKLEKAWEEYKTIKTVKLSDNARFLSIINATEDLHRTFFEKTTPEQKKEFKQRLKKISDQLADPEDKKLIKTRLKNAYEPSLLNRLMDIYNLGRSYGVAQTGNDVIEKAVATRHDLVHSLKTDKSKLLSPNEMYEINQRFSMYFKIAILKVIGIRDDELKKIAKESHQFKHYYHDNR